MEQTLARRKTRSLTRKAEMPLCDDIVLTKRPCSVVLENVDHLINRQAGTSIEQPQSQAESEFQQVESQTPQITETAEEIAENTQIEEVVETESAMEISEAGDVVEDGQIGEGAQVDEPTEAVEDGQIGEGSQVDEAVEVGEGSSAKKRKQHMSLLHNNHTWHRNKGLNDDATVYYDCAGK